MDGEHHSVNERLLEALCAHTAHESFHVDGQAVTLAHKALSRLQHQDLSHEVMDLIEATLVEFMRKLDRQLILAIDSNQEELEQVLDQRESNRFVNSMKYLSKISNAFAQLPPAQTWMPILVGFFLLNEQVRDIVSIEYFI